MPGQLARTGARGSQRKMRLEFQLLEFRTLRGILAQKNTFVPRTIRANSHPE